MIGRTNKKREATALAPNLTMACPSSIEKRESCSNLLPKKEEVKYGIKETIGSSFSSRAPVVVESLNLSHAEQNSKDVIKSIINYLDIVGQVFAPIESKILAIVNSGNACSKYAKPLTNEVQQKFIIQEIKSIQRHLRSIRTQITAFLPSKIRLLRGGGPNFAPIKSYHENLLVHYVELQKCVLQFQNKIASLNHHFAEIIQQVRGTHSRGSIYEHIVGRGSTKKYITHELYLEVENFQKEICNIIQQVGHEEDSDKSEPENDYYDYDY